MLFFWLFFFEIITTDIGQGDGGLNEMADILTLSRFCMFLQWGLIIQF